MRRNIKLMLNMWQIVRALGLIKLDLLIIPMQTKGYALLEEHILPMTHAFPVINLGYVFLLKMEEYC